MKLVKLVVLFLTIHSYFSFFLEHVNNAFEIINNALERGGGGAKRLPLPKICHTHPTMMKLGRVIPYPKKIQKIYESRDTPLEFC